MKFPRNDSRWKWLTRAGLAAIALAGAGVIGWPVWKSHMQLVVLHSKLLPQTEGAFLTARVARSLRVDTWPGTPFDTLPVEIWHPTDLKDKAGVRNDSAFPLLLLAPGWDGARHGNSYLAAGLASRGYVVVAFDDVGAGSPQQPRPTQIEPLLGSFDLSTQETYARSLEVVARRLDQMVRRTRGVIDEVERLAQGGDAALMRLDVGRIGFVGFSFGGSVAVEATWSEPRLKAVVNMDGWMFGRSAKHGANAPYLIFNSDFDVEHASRSRSLASRLTAEITRDDRKLQIELHGSGRATALMFRGSNHGDFTDGLFAPSLTTYLKQWSRRDRDRLRLHQAIEETSADFLDRHLRPTAAPPPGREQRLKGWPIESLRATSQ